MANLDRPHSENEIGINEVPMHRPVSQDAESLLDHGSNDTSTMDESCCNLAPSPDIEIDLGPDKPSSTVCGNQSQITFSAWPSGPQGLKHSKRGLSVDIALDVMLVLIAACFFGVIALAVGALALNTQAAPSQMGSIVNQAQILGPTVFPILFAALTGRALRSIGRYLAERGVSIQALWQTLNSRTIFEAFLNTITLRRVTFGTVCLVFVWCLSPLGGQACIRIVYSGTNTTELPRTIKYLDTGPKGAIQLMELLGGSQPENYFEEDQELYHRWIPGVLSPVVNGLLIQSTESKARPLDMWGNIKIPRIERFRSQTPDGEGWFEFDWEAVQTDRDVEAYSSLMGLLLGGVPTTGLLRFPLESTYLTADCEPLESQVMDEKHCSPDFHVNASLIETDDFPKDGPSRNSSGTRATQYLGFRTTESHCFPWSQQSLRGPRHLSLEIHSPCGPSTASCVKLSTTCALRSSAVETVFECHSMDCIPVKIRRSRLDKRDPDLTFLDTINPTWIGKLFENTRRDDIDWINPSIVFLNDSTTPFITYGLPPYNVGNLSIFTDVSNKIFSERVSMLLSAYWYILSSNASLTLTGIKLQSSDDPHWKTPPTPRTTFETLGDICPERSETKDGPGNWLANLLYNLTEHLYNASDHSSDISLYKVATALANLANTSADEYPAASVRASWTQKQNIYITSIPWAITLLVCSTTLMVVGLTGIYYSTKIRAPDVFDPVMGLTYNNPYIDFLSSGNTLDATTRARHLRDVQVQLGDVDGKWGVGKIGLGTMDRVAPLKSDRLYE